MSDNKPFDKPALGCFAAFLSLASTAHETPATPALMPSSPSMELSMAGSSPSRNQK